MKPTVAYGMAAVGVVNMVFIIVSIATAGWLTLFGTGAFNIFSAILNVPTPSEIEAVRAFMLLGLFAQIGAVIVCVMMALQKLDKKIIAVILFVVSAAFLALALIIFAAYVNKLSSLSALSYGHSYVLSWIACISSIIAGAVIGLSN